jgi:geranylgeranyl pyrophosphate synthase
MLEALMRLLGEVESGEHLTASLTLLPLLACEAAGSGYRRALPAAGAWLGLHLASILLDDVEDGDAARLSAGSGGLSRLVNLATGLYAAAGLCLELLPPEVRLDLSSRVQRTILRMTGGQHRELSGDPGEGVSDVLRHAGDKTACFFALGALMGARCATEDSERVRSLAAFGHHAGMVVQLSDDLVDLLKPGPDGDIASGRRTPPVAYALEVASPEERARLEALLQAARHEPTAEAEARAFMLELGAESFVLAEVSRHRRRAHESLAAARSADGSACALARLRTWLSEFETLAVHGTAGEL